MIQQAFLSRIQRLVDIRLHHFRRMVGRFRVLLVKGIVGIAQSPFEKLFKHGQKPIPTTKKGFAFITKQRNLQNVVSLLAHQYPRVIHASDQMRALLDHRLFL
jgi:hypothetical protein